jgi:hypothetical protein
MQEGGGEGHPPVITFCIGPIFFTLSRQGQFSCSEDAEIGSLLLTLKFNIYRRDNSLIVSFKIALNGIVRRLSQNPVRYRNRGTQFGTVILPVPP